MSGIARIYLKVLGWYTLSSNTEYIESQFDTTTQIMDLADTLGLQITTFTINREHTSSVIDITIEI